MAFGLAGDDAGDRIGRALAPSFAVARAVPVTVDLWIEPPAYTGRPTLFAGVAETRLELPAGSVIHARVTGIEDRVVLTAGPDRMVLEGSGAVAEGNMPIRMGGRIAVLAGDRELAGWLVAVVPDHPPTARFEMPPTATRRHALRLDYGGNDDYGIATMWIEAVPTDEPDAEPLILSLPVLGEVVAPRGNAYFDLTAHIWAGRDVTMQVFAVDDAEQEGEGPPLQFVLPERVFDHPVARAIIEERKILRWEDKDASAERLDGIAAGVELYDRDSVVTLVLAVASARLRGTGKEESTLKSVRSLLWKTALRLEDGGLALADRELRASQDAIMQALEQGAPAEEIDRLFDELHRSIDRLLQELASRAGQAGEAAQPESDSHAQDRLLDREGLQQMVEQIRRLWEAGARDEAKELLAQLQNILENIRMARMDEGQAERQADMLNRLRELRELGRDQQRLLDRTFRHDRQTPEGERQGPQQGAEGGYSSLQQAQDALRRRLGEYMRRLGEGEGRASEQLGRADGSMRGASGALRAGNRGEALEAQGQALRNLQQASDSLLEGFAREGGGQGNMAGEQPSFDPLGRRDGGFMSDGRDILLPEEERFQRARHIRDELRRRVGDDSRPLPERDYIERLLRRF